MNNTVRYLIRVLVAINMGMLSIAAHATDIDGMMNQVFANTLSNYTPGGSYTTQGRGVIAGPTFYSRNRISNINLYDIQLPKIKSGCSGIDAFTGSFSFISGDELVNVLRNIAAAAPTYAFGIALGALCKDCEAQMAKLQEKLNKWSGIMKNSCEAAKYLVDESGLSKGIRDGLKPYEIALGGEWGVFTDFLGPDSAPEAPSARIEAADPAGTVLQDVHGNVGWKVITQNDIATWFSAGVGEDNQGANEVIMSFTGSIINRMGPAEGGGRVARVVPLGPLISVDQFMQGGTVDVYTCDTVARCENPTRYPRTIEGFRTIVGRNLFGLDGISGIVGKLTSNLSSDAYSLQEQRFINFMPSGILAQLHSLGKDRSVMRKYAEAAADYIASEMAAQYLTLTYESLIIAAGEERKDPSVGVWIKQLEANKQDLNAKIAQLQTRMDAREKNFALAERIRQNLREHLAGVAGIAPNSR